MGHVRHWLARVVTVGAVGAVCTVVTGLGTSAASADTTTAAHVAAEQTMVEWTDWVIRDVDAYWADVFASYGQDWPGVSWVTADEGERWPSTCGEQVGDPDVYPSVSPAFYCTLDATVYLSMPFLYETWLNTGDFGSAVVIAHEMGHHVQTILSVDNPPWSPNISPYELQADCLAGVWAGAKRDSGQLETGDLDEGISAMLALGDYEVEVYDHHGTPEERASAFVNGYDVGLSAC